MIKKIAHIADIHLKKNEMYHEQFYSFEKNFLKSIKEEFNGISFEERLIVIAGDLYDNKDQHSHKCDIILYRFLKSCLEIAPVIAIPGNHDYLNREDDLFLLEKTAMLLEDPNLFFIKEPKSFICDNIYFHHFSNLYNSEPPIDMKRIIDEYPDYVHIGLYHERLRNCEAYGYVFDQFEKDANDLFVGLDYVFLGDIHMFQEIKYKTGIAVYPGSPYQLGAGETIINHGYVLWSMEKENVYKYKFVLLNNDFNFVKISGNIDQILNDDKYKILNND